MAYTLHGWRKQGARLELLQDAPLADMLLCDRAVVDVDPVLAKVVVCVHNTVMTQDGVGPTTVVRCVR